MSIMPQINHHDPYAPIVRKASRPAPQTHAYRQSVGTNAGLHREDIPSTTTEQKPKRTGYDGVPLKLGRRSPVLADDAVLDEEDEDEYDPGPTRPPSSARRYVQPLAGEHEDNPTERPRPMSSTQVHNVPLKDSTPNHGSNAAFFVVLTRCSG